MKIHDLNPEDKMLLEIEMDDVPRGIEFIYKSAGVNRPLGSKEENPQENLNHTIYRDKLNKISLAITEIIESMETSFTPEQVEEKLISLKKRIERKHRI